MTLYKPLINVGCNDEDYYARKRKISYAGETSQEKHRYRKVFNTLRETEITLVGKSLRNNKQWKKWSWKEKGPKTKGYALGITIFWCKLWDGVIERCYVVKWYGQVYILETPILEEVCRIVLRERFEGRVGGRSEQWWRLLDGNP